MSNGYYTPSGNPAIGSQALSALMRGEFISLSAAFDLLPALPGAAGTAVVVNGGGNGLTTTVGQLALAGNLATTGPFNTVFAQQASVTLTLPAVTGTLADLADVASAVAAGVAAAATVTTNAVAVETARAMAWEASPVLPVASTTVSGAVMIDGTTVQISPAGVISSVAGAGAEIFLPYANRGNLRFSESTFNAVVESLGQFNWVAASTEPDDDETCFATTNGAWVLDATDPDYDFASWIAEFDNVQSRASDLETRATTDEAAITALQAKFLSGSFAMTLTTLATVVSANFTATVTGAAPGDRVVVNPGDQFGTSAADQGRLSYAAYVPAPNTVTVSIRNASAATATLTASTWAVLVIKQ